MSSEPTVFIVDDDTAGRESLEAMIHSMGLQSSSFASAEQFLTDHNFDLPGCLILDMRLPEMTGLELQERLVAEGKKIPIIFLSAYGDVRSSVRAMQMGAVTFLEKPWNSEQLRENINKAIEQDAKTRKMQIRRSEMVAKIAQLTSKERDVMERIVAGKADKVIASELDISLRTVQFRKSSILNKTGVDSWASLVELVLSVRKPPQ